MRICILFGSPKPNGNTAEICKPFMDELRILGAEVEYIPLYEKNISPCKGCFHCQHIEAEFGCAQQDDMQAIVGSIMKADILVFATPIYTWQATAPIKAVMDRMYALNKYYGSVPRSVLNKGQSYALITTCGYEPGYGAGLLEEGIRRWSKHSKIPYLGMYGVQDKGDPAAFRTEEVIAGARDFARKLMTKG